MTGLGPVNEGETVKPIVDPRGREQQPDDAALDELRKAFGVVPDKPVTPASERADDAPTQAADTPVADPLPADEPPADEPPADEPPAEPPPVPPSMCRRPAPVELGRQLGRRSPRHRGSCASTTTPPRTPSRRRPPARLPHPMQLVDEDPYLVIHRSQ